MASAITNKSNGDIVDLSVEQTGSSTSEVFLEEVLLDATRDYVVGCVEMCVPLSDEPMITFNITTKDLITVRRRPAGARANTADDDLAPQLIGVETLDLNEGYKMYSPTDFISYISNWAARFSDAVSVIGLEAAGVVGGAIIVNDTIAADDVAINRKVHNGVALLRVGITSSGVVQLVGSHYFWRNFYIVGTVYAESLLGVPSTICVSIGGGGLLSQDPALLDNGAVPALLIAPNIPAQPPIPYNGSHSMFRFLEERLYISLEVELSVPWNVLIRDGRESKTHQIANYPFENKYTTTVMSSDSVLGSEISIEMDTHISRFHFQRKSDPNFNWYPVQSSYMIQNSRLQLYITRRRFRYNADGTGTWYYDKKPVNIHKDAVWNTTLKFITVY